MSEYDKTKDVVIEDYGDVEGTDFNVSTRSYDGGPPKISVVQVLGKNRDKIKPVFRFPPSEVVPLAAFLLEHFGEPAKT